MDPNEQVMLKIVKELENFQECPYDRYTERRKKEEISISKFTMEEMLELIWDHPWNDPIDILEEFALKCGLFKATSKLSDQKRIFSISEKTALKFIEEIKGEMQYE